MKRLIFCILLTSTQAHAGLDLEKTLKDLAGGNKDEQSEPATDPNGLTSDDQLSGLRQAMSQGVELAVRQLAANDGFNGNPKVRITIPQSVESVAKMARKLGQGRYVDELELTMNRAAEQAVPATTDILIDAVNGMTVDDAMTLINGEDDAVTQYFRSHSQQQLEQAIRPIIADATESSGVSQAYEKLQDKGGSMMSSLLGGETTDLNDHVTEKTLDALFVYIAEQERSIREDPVARTTDLLRTLFGN